MHLPPPPPHTTQASSVLRAVFHTLASHSFALTLQWIRYAIELEVSVAEHLCCLCIHHAHGREQVEL